MRKEKQGRVKNCDWNNGGGVVVTGADEDRTNLVCGTGSGVGGMLTLQDEVVSYL